MSEWSPNPKETGKYSEYSFQMNPYGCLPMNDARFVVKANLPKDINNAILYERALNKIATPWLMEAFLELERAVEEILEQSSQNPVDKP